MKPPAIQFHPAMIRAIERGMKTQTRRLEDSPLAALQPGDWAWVQEPYSIDRLLGGRGVLIRYAAGDGQAAVEWPAHLNMPQPGPKAARFLPRALSRFTLEIRWTRRERLWEIDEADAIAEGMFPWGDGRWRSLTRTSAEMDAAGKPALCDTARHAFGEFWDALHPVRGYRWEDNPAVAVLGFDLAKEPRLSRWPGRGPSREG